MIASWLETIAIVLTYTVAAAVQLCGAGAGEPFVTAAGVLGLMSVWRCFYTACEGLAYDFFSVHFPKTAVQLAAPCSAMSLRTLQYWSLHVAPQTSTSGTGGRLGVRVWIATVTAQFLWRRCAAHPFWPSALAPPSGSYTAGSWPGRLVVCRMVVC